MSDPQPPPDLALVAVTLSDLQVTLSSLATELARHPPGDSTPVLQALGELRHEIAQGAGGRRSPSGSKVVLGAMLVLGLWAGFVLYELWATPRIPDRFLRLFQGVDEVVVVHYGQLSKPVQGKLNAVYTRAGAESPAQRQKK